MIEIGDTPRTGFKDTEEYKMNLAWARSPGENEPLLRRAARELGLDTREMMLGFALSTMQDDGNAFSMAFFPSFEQQFTAEKGDAAREQLAIRMQWESELAEMPDNFKEMLTEVHESLQRDHDWSTPEGFQRAYEFWRKNRKAIEEIASMTPGLEDAQGVYFLHQSELSQKMTELRKQQNA